MFKRKTTSLQIIYWSLLNYENWHFYIGITEAGLCYVGPNHYSFEDLVKWASKNSVNPKFVEEQHLTAPYKLEIVEYLKGERKDFSSPIHYFGTDFQKSVWTQLEKIPYGEVRTYSEIAAAINKPAAVRAVAGAIGANPILIVVPCHRVIGKNGSLTGYRGGIKMKKELLEIEGYSI